MNKLILMICIIFAPISIYAQSREDLCRQIYQQLQDSNPQTNPQLALQNSLARAQAWTQFDSTNALAQRDAVERAQQQRFLQLTDLYLKNCQ